MSVDLPWKAERLSNAAIEVKIQADKHGGWEQYFLLSADRHTDNAKSDRALQIKHMKQAQERNAGIIDVGDLFCAMQGRNDKRANLSDMRPEYLGLGTAKKPKPYFDAIKSDLVDFYSPYAHNFIAFGKGNHETAILRHHEIDLTTEFVERLNLTNNSNVHSTGYGYWVVFKVLNSNIDDKDRKSRKQAATLGSIKLNAFHGHGGGGPVTKGVIQAQRMATYLPNADIVLTGHVHESTSVEYPRAILTDRGNILHHTQLHLRTPTYKEEYRDGTEGYHVEKGRPPKPLGAWWIRLYYDNATKKIDYDYTRAK